MWGGVWGGGGGGERGGQGGMSCTFLPFLFLKHVVLLADLYDFLLLFRALCSPCRQ